MALDKRLTVTDNLIGSIAGSAGQNMGEPAEQKTFLFHVAQDATRRRRVVVVSSDKTFSESLRSHLAGEFDVLLARNAGEAAAKASAVAIDLAVVDLGAPLLGIPALNRMRELTHVPVLCGLTTLADPSAAESQFDFDFILARPDTGADLPDRIRFILAKAEVRTRN